MELFSGFTDRHSDTNFRVQRILEADILIYWIGFLWNFAGRLTSTKSTFMKQNLDIRDNSHRFVSVCGILSVPFCLSWFDFPFA